ncbi:MAG: hypothetical protein ACFE7E_02750 [Candidatus Hodarchaeota archaeon]
MGRRRRKKIVTRPKPKIPSIFACPACGKQAVRVEMFKVQGVADIRCSNCGLEEKSPIHDLSEPVDVYGDLAGSDLDPPLNRGPLSGRYRNRD